MKPSNKMKADAELKKELDDNIKEAKWRKDANNMEQGTIWEIKHRKDGINYNFNFEKKEVGFSYEYFGIKFTVVAVV